MVVRVVTPSELDTLRRRWRQADIEMSNIAAVMRKTWDGVDMAKLGYEYELAKEKRNQAFCAWQSAEAAVPRRVASSTTDWRRSSLYDRRRGLLTRDMDSATGAKAK